MVLAEHLLAEQRVRLAVAEVAGRRADQLGDLVAVLELGAVDLNDSAWVLHQRLSRRLHDAGLPGARRPQKQEIAHRPSRCAHPCQIHLVNVDDLLDRFVLADDQATQTGFERLGLSAGSRRIQWKTQPRHCQVPFLRGAHQPYRSAKRLPLARQPSLNGLTALSGLAASPRHFRGLVGLTSTRLIKVRSGIRRIANTMSAMSSAAIFQSAFAPPGLNSVSTLPGMT